MRSKLVLEADGSRKRGRGLKGDDSTPSGDPDAMYFSMGSRIVQARAGYPEVCDPDIHWTRLNRSDHPSFAKTN